MSTTHSSFDQYCISHKTILVIEQLLYPTLKFKVSSHDLLSSFAAPRNKYSLGGGAEGRTAPGDTFQGVTPEGQNFCVQIYKE